MTTQHRREFSEIPASAVSSSVSSSVADQSSSSLAKAEVVALRQELETLRAEFAAFRAAMTPTESVASPTATVIPGADESEHDQTGVTTSRRTLLKWGGVGAAAALAAAGGASLTSQTAHADTGGNFILGTSNTASLITQLTADGDTDGLHVTSPSTSFDTTGIIGEGRMFGVKGNPLVDGGTGILGTCTGGFAVHGTSSANGVGVMGESVDYYGVWGQSNTFPGVLGYSTNNTGVSGFSPNNVGVSGSSTSSIGVQGASQSAVDLAAIGTGRFLQATTSTVGAPTSGSYLVGEQIRDHNGDLYICVVSGSPGTWRKVAAGVPGVSGAINFLANPIRLLDTRTGSAWLGGSTHSFQVTGVTISGLKVPVGAVGVVGNLTVVRATAAGDLRLYPGSTAPATSSINFASGQVIANGVTIGLSSAGKLNVKVDMASSADLNVLFDASGYIL